jgi:hypothetical protein
MLGGTRTAQEVLSEMWLLAGENYLLFATIHNEKTTAVAISIAHAACEQPHRISTSLATVTGLNSATLDFG